MKRIISTFLSLALLLSLAVLPASAEESPRYSDTADHWAESSIERWSGYGVVQGDAGAFRPDAPLTRGELATIFANLLGLEEEAENPYADLNGDEWYAAAILKCTAAGIVQGDGVGCSAAAPVTRQEASVMTARALGIAPAEQSSLSAFPDGEQVAAWAAGLVSAMVDAGILTGTDSGSILPESSINRASMAAILDRAISVYANESGAYVQAAGGGIVLIAAPNASITVSEAVDQVLLAPGARGASLTVNKGGCVTALIAQADNVTISGSGKVETAFVSGDNTKVNIDGTQLTVAEGTTGVTENGKTVSGGEAVVTKASAGSGSASGGSGTPAVSGVSITVDNAITGAYDKTNANLGNEVSLSGGAVTGTLGYVESPLWTDGGNHYFVFKLSGMREGDTVTTVDNLTKEFTVASDGSLEFTWAVTESSDYIDITVARPGYTAYQTRLDLTGLIRLVSGAVAVVGENSYADLADAITAAGENGTVKVVADVGSSDHYTTYKVENAITIQGNGTAAIYGNFTVIADGAVFEQLVIKNKGDAAGENTEARNAINAACKTLTITNCTFNLTNGSGGISNGLSIWPTDTNVDYTITDNHFEGYQTTDSGYVSGAIIISGGINKAFTGKGASVPAAMTDEQDLAIITGNRFTNCKGDYCREDWTNGNEVFCKAVSSGDNLYLEGAAATARYYITGDMNRSSDATVKAGTTLTVTEGKTLTIASGSTLTVEEGAAIEGTIVGAVKRGEKTTVYNSPDFSVQIYAGNSGTGWDEYSSPAGHWLCASASINTTTITCMADSLGMKMELYQGDTPVATWTSEGEKWSAWKTAYGSYGYGTIECYFPSTDVTEVRVGNIITDNEADIKMDADFDHSDDYSTLRLVATLTLDATTSYVSQWELSV